MSVYRNGYTWAEIKRKSPTAYNGYVKARLELWHIIRYNQKSDRFDNYVVLPLLGLSMLAVIAGIIIKMVK